MTINPPLFSIITVTKDNLDGLQKTAHSIRHQSLHDFEWVIIDGNSGDGTKEYLQTLDARYVSEPDSGIYNAMNKGVGLSTGQYLIFMNAGDCLADMDILATVARAIKTHTPDFIYGDALETNGLYKKARPHAKINAGMFTHHQAMFYKHNCIGTLRYDETLKIAADYGFTAAFLKYAPNAHYMPCALCIFEDGGISQQRRTLGRREQFSIRKKNGIVAAENFFIYMTQTISATLRTYWPSLYYRLRTRPTMR